MDGVPDFFYVIANILLTKILIYHRVSLYVLNEKKYQQRTGKGKRKADMTSLRELPIGKNCDNTLCRRRGRAAATFPGYGADSKRRSYHGEICTNGRSYGITYS